MCRVARDQVTVVADDLSRCTRAYVQLKLEKDALSKDSKK